MSFIDLYKWIHREAIQQEFPPSARGLLDALVYQFNEAFWIDSLVFSERDLSALTGLPPASVHRAKHFLTSRQLIKCKPFKNKVEFSLGDELLKVLQAEPPQKSNEAVVKQLWSSSEAVVKQSRSSFENPNIRARAKTEDIKTEDPSAEEADARTRTRVDRNEKTLEAMDVHDLWFYETGWQLRGSVGLELEQLDQKHGRDAVHRAITETVKANPRNYFNYFKAVLKGGDQNVRPQQSGNRTAGIYGTVDRRPTSSDGATQARTSGKGSFDDEPEPDYSWFYDAAGNSA